MWPHDAIKNTVTLSCGRLLLVSHWQTASESTVIIIGVYDGKSTISNSIAHDHDSEWGTGHHHMCLAGFWQGIHGASLSVSRYCTMAL